MEYIKVMWVPLAAFLPALLFLMPTEKAKVYDVRSITLPNGLEAALIHNPKAAQSAAAMNVGIGSFHNPPKVSGLAHFVEHMLFLGTDKYPESNAYQSFLAKNQGDSNASTSGEYTEFYFRVNHAGLFGALDRFSQFFISPLFNDKYLQFEKNAVDSEHSRNISKEGRRAFRVFQLLHAENHPMRIYTTGNLASLKKLTRADAVKFFNRYYSAHRMKLAIYGKASLDSLEKMVREHFAAVKRRPVKKELVSGEVFSLPLPRIAEVRPFGKDRSLELHFSGRSLRSEWKSKVYAVIRFLFVQDGPDTLKNHLKQKGWIKDLYVYRRNYQHKYYFEFGFDLTEEGEGKIDEIIREFFTFTAKMKQEGYKEHLFELLQGMRQLNYDFISPGRASNVATFFAELMWRFPAGQILQNTKLIFEKKEELFLEVMAWFKPSNMNLLWISEKASVNKKEPYMGVEYSISAVEKIRSQYWQSSSETVYKYPKRNHYIPHELRVLNDGTVKWPEKLRLSGDAEVWFQQTPEWEKPKAKIGAKLYSRARFLSPKEKAASILLQKLISDSMQGWKQELRAAGIYLRIMLHKNGIFLNISGYSQHLLRVYRQAIRKIKDFEPSLKRFNLLKQATVKSYSELDYMQATSQAEMHVDAATEQDLHPYIYRDDFATLKLSDVVSRHSVLTSSSKLYAFAHGNLRKSEVQKALPRISKAWGASSSNYNREQDNYKYLWLPKGKPLAVIGAGCDKFSLRKRHQRRLPLFGC